MNGDEQAITQREARVIQIPDGTPMVLPAGTSVRIAQALGDTYTLVTPRGQMVRLDSKDADVIGKEAPAAQEDGEAGSLEEQVWAQLRTCFDPEIPVNIVDLGLIYDCTVTDPDASGQRQAQVKMTLTAPGCGMGPVLKQDVENKLISLEGVDDVNVELVWEPQWNQGMMTEAAKLQLGLM
jgi:probable FeS assembly SUF system protein SufT